MDYLFELNFEVRDYELDAQSVVNNATYMNYLEHTRHAFLKAIGMDFVQLHHEGIDPMVIKSELNYKRPLRSNDLFSVKINIERQGPLKILFLQEIYRGDELSLEAKVWAVCVNNKSGRPIKPDAFDFHLEDYKKKV